MAGSDPAFLDRMRKKVVTEEAKAVAREAVVLRMEISIVPIRVD
ncbi:MAG: hypothetical protein ACHRXM_30740 [Isosphaerales bacterium]